MPNETFFVRLTFPYERLQTVIASWALQADTVVCYEHIGTETEKVHCHILIQESRVCKKRLQQIAKQAIPVIKGNAYMSFKTPTDGQNPRGAITYMSKGNLEPKYFKGIERDEINDLRDQWIEHPKKVSRYDVLYNHFEDYYVKLARPQLTDEEKADEEVKISIGFTHLTSAAKRYVFDQNNNIWSPRCVTDYKTIVWTHVMRNNIPIPQKSLFKKELY